MIDLSKNGSSETEAPCPYCNKIKEIASIVGDFATSKEEDIAAIIDLMAAELRMWRAKDEYGKKIKASILNMMKNEMGDDEP